MYLDLERSQPMRFLGVALGLQYVTAMPYKNELHVVIWFAKANLAKTGARLNIVGKNGCVREMDLEKDS